MLWVENGRSFASIIVGPACSPVERFAAKELSKYVGRITGIPLPITSKPASGPQVFVGRSATLDKLS